MVENKILVISNNSNNTITIQSLLKKEGYNSTITNQLDSHIYFGLIKNLRPSLIIINTLEHNLEILKNLRTLDFLNPTPIMIISTIENEDEKLEALDIGVDDYLYEPINMTELFLKIRNTIKRIYASRWTNPLTGLPSNIEINNELEQKIMSKELFAVIYLDLDNFKSYNDVYGFSNGDRLIKYTGNVIKTAMSKFKTNINFVGHIGGDDFIVITTPDVCEQFSEEVIKKFDAKLPTFYSEEDRAKKYIETTNRLGEQQQFPLVTISIAIITNEKRFLYSPVQIGEIAAEIKNKAKSIDGSCYFKDRRKG